MFDLLRVLIHFFFHLLITSLTTIRDYMYFLYHKYLGAELLNINRDAKHIVVLVHGRNSSPTQFVDIQKKLSTTIDSETTLFPIFFPSGSTSITTDCQSLYQQLLDYFGDKKSRELTIIGISKGGVTACYAATLNHPLFRVKKIITISSPLKGTQLANFSLCPVTRKELSYHSPFLIDVERRLMASRVKIYHIVPRWDHIVIPTEATSYSQTPSQRIMKYRGFSGHIGIQYDKTVIEQINQWIHDLS